MATRTAAAQTLDTKIDDMLTALDSYLALAAQPGEPQNSVAEFFMATLIAKLGTRTRMKPMIFSNKRDLRAYSAALLPTNTVEARDPNA